MQSDDSAIPASDPFMLFEVWYAEAKEAEPNDPNAMALATASEDGFFRAHGSAQGPRNRRFRVLHQCRKPQG